MEILKVQKTNTNTTYQSITDVAGNRIDTLQEITEQKINSIIRLAKKTDILSVEVTFKVHTTLPQDPTKRLDDSFWLEVALGTWVE